MTRFVLPPLEIVGPSGGRITLRSLDRADTVATLTARLGVDALWTQGRKLAPDERIDDIDELAIGASLSATPPSGDAMSSRRAGSDSANGAVVDVVIVTGPACGPPVALAPGRHVIGRSPDAAIHVVDPSIEAHHALLDVDADGDVSLTQLTGRTPLRVDGCVVDGCAHVPVGSSIEIGSSTLTVATAGLASRSKAVRRAGGRIGEHPTDPWRRLVWRSPVSASVWDASSIVAPERPAEPSRPAATGLIGVAATATGAVVIAFVMGNPMFLMFAAIGLFATLATFVVGVASAFRARRRIRARHVEQMATFGEDVDALHARRVLHHRRAHPLLNEMLDVLFETPGDLWQWRADERLGAVVGVGTARWQPEIELSTATEGDPMMLQRVEQCARLADVGAPITLEPGDTVAVHGALAQCRALARSVIVQAALRVGPADWQLVVVSGDRRAWEWADWLPHAARERCAVIGGDARELGEHLDTLLADRLTLVVTDEPLLLTARTGPLRRFLADSSAMALVLVADDSVVPAPCRRVVTLGATGSASWSGDVPDCDDAVGIRFSGVSLHLADEVARRLSCLIDPEDADGAGAVIPSSVSLAELLPTWSTTPEAIAERWRSGGSDPAPIAPLGMSGDGRVDIDLVRDGPHALIAGTTGSGKSELLRTLVVSLAASVSPRHVSFVLVDYKGGSTFDACTALPHTVGMVTDLDEGLAERALVSLDAELHRRERLLRAAGASDLAGYRERDEGDPIARLVVVIDEFAALASELPEFLSALVGIAQRGRSLGVHLLLATQRPAGVVNDDIRANTNLRLALRLHDRPDAIDVVGNELPANFPRGVPGRAAMRLGPDDLVVFQAGRCTGPAVDPDDGVFVDIAVPDRGEAAMADVVRDASSELEVAVAAIVSAAAAERIEAPHRPWVEPLPFPLQSATVADSGAPTIDGIQPVGLLDDPSQQCRRPLTWGPRDGSVALIGAVGSGTTSTMIAMVAAMCRSIGPEALHFYVVDARGDDGLGSLAALAHCGGVVRLGEEERLHRLLHRVVQIIDDRVSNPTGSRTDGVEVVVLIDGYASLRSALGAVERTGTFELLLRVVNDGAAAGVALVVADDAGSAVSTVPVAHRWVFALDDPSAARGMGLRASPVGGATPGRFRIVGSGLEAQVVQGAPGLAELPTHDSMATGPELVEALPERVEASELAANVSRVRVDDVVLSMGRSGVDLGTDVISVPIGEHLMVIGGARTGVSTALERCLSEWTTALATDGAAPIVVRVGRRSPLDPTALRDVSRPALVVVDDAHRVDDDGELARIAQGERPHVSLLVGARADGVRSGYGHWTREVAKSRCGIVMSSRGDPDGDLLGVQIPRRPLVPARPGLGWIVDSGPVRQVQIAVVDSVTPHDV